MKFVCVMVVVKKQALSLTEKEETYVGEEDVTECLSEGPVLHFSL